MSDLLDGEYVQSEAAVEAAERMLERQITLIEHGTHPLTQRTDIHAQADHDAGPLDPPDLPYRCGTCRFRETGRWAKCAVQHRDQTSATDVRPWWPACVLYKEAS